MCQLRSQWTSLALAAVVLAGGACGGGSGDGDPVGGVVEPAIAQEIANAFPHTPNQPFDAVYIAGRQGSTLVGYVEFRADSTLEMCITDDTHADYAFAGTYTYAGGAIRVMMPPDPPVRATGPNTSPLFPLGLDETSTIALTQFGFVAGFATPTMVFVLAGHGANPANPILVQYLCPAVDDQPQSYEENSLEFGLVNRPFGAPMPGSLFRQRDLVLKNDPFNPRITRAYGVYRTVGDTFYASFRIAADFAAFAQSRGVVLPVPIPAVPPFDPNEGNLLKGSFLAGGTQVTANEIGTQGPCNRQ